MHSKNFFVKGSSSNSTMDLRETKLDIQKILKEVEHFGASHMTWKDRKKIENQKIASLGGKPPKKQKLPLSIARNVIKKQKKRKEESLFEGSWKLGRSTNGGREEKRKKVEERGLHIDGGCFRKGVLDVNHLLKRGASRDDNDRDCDHDYFIEGRIGKKMKGSKGKKNGGKNRGGRYGKRH